ncbi:chromosome partitioning protein [Actinokineospora sp. NBRC 105648]|uniref:chromosome partitioning protein n=1 Tax=Actinokineospora sp. NBRC 105648 TaxID=3032206 RepID=UPI0024A5A467|nr:chromosome partitioning protein [Actinokineospora sp. NBRC 105648]GLZ37882.1 hypothetical protein Acsp05_15060 [Actinokineospora sp. NBRC 105648]
MLVVVFSLKGSPGVTTLALALAARWPEGPQPIVVECDPAGGDLVARYRLEQAPGLVSLAAAGRRSSDPGLLQQHTQELPGGLRVVVGPVGAEQARATLVELAQQQTSAMRAAADTPDTVVIADCGRVDPDSPAMSIIRSADAMLLVTRARDDQLAHVSGKLRSVARWGRRPGLVVVGEGYPTSEIERALGVNVMGRIPHEDKDAAALAGRPGRGRSPAKSSLGRAAARIAAQLVSQYAEPSPTTAHMPRLASPGPSSDEPTFAADNESGARL